MAQSKSYCSPGISAMFCFIKPSLQNLQPGLCGRSMGHCTGGSKALDPGVLFPEAVGCARRGRSSRCVGRKTKTSESDSCILFLCMGMQWGVVEPSG